MEKVEVQRVGAEIAQREELAANHGRRKGFFIQFELKTATQAKNRAKALNRQDSLDDPAIELEWQRALDRGSKYVIKDVDEHFKLKNTIKNMMLQIASTLA